MEFFRESENDEANEVIAPGVRFVLIVYCLESVSAQAGCQRVRHSVRQSLSKVEPHLHYCDWMRHYHPRFADVAGRIAGCEDL